MNPKIRGTKIDRSVRDDKRRGFTLMEMLVVVAIMAMLAALLLPVLSRPRVAAKRAICVNDLRQINLALRAYTDDHADWLRAAPRDFQIYFTYRQSLQPYLSRNGSSTNDQLFACPADDFDCATPAIQDFFYSPSVSGKGFHHLSQTLYSSYIFNGQGAHSTGERVTEKPFSATRQPSRLVLAGELSGAIGLSAHGRGRSGQYKDAKNVMSFVDGHASFLPIYWNGNTGANDMPCQYNPPSGYDYVWFDR